MTRDDQQILDLVLGELQGMRKHGGYWDALCPAHGDQRQSLTVKRGTETAVLLHCHAGCDFGAVLDALGLTPADIGAAREKTSQDDWTPAGPAIATYNYVDESGTLLCQVCRTAGKQFPQRRPDPTSASGWRWKLGDTRRVLYRLPRILAAPPEYPIFVVEGEKDVHALEAAGEYATCCPGGAGKWRDEYSGALTGRDVLVVADKDKPGREHARQVAASVEPHGKFTWIVQAAEGKDAADHFAAGHGVTDFRWWTR